ncbi:MAG: hypothetical protein F6K32_08700, partial [Desertifilum sp. SIO1I2]|nr:hypothetical protein [Desertifilum sp. SIO1I2]
GHVNVSFYMGWIGDAAFAVAALHGWPREQMMAEQAGVAAVKAAGIFLRINFSYHNYVNITIRQILKFSSFLYQSIIIEVRLDRSHC